MKTALVDLWVLYLTCGLLASHAWLYAYVWRTHVTNRLHTWNDEPLKAVVKHIVALVVVAFVLMFYWPSWFAPKYRARMLQYFPPKYQKPATEL